jgi:hypothetical protein
VKARVGHWIHAPGGEAEAQQISPAAVGAICNLDQAAATEESIPCISRDSQDDENQASQMKHKAIEIACRGDELLLHDAVSYLSFKDDLLSLRVLLFAEARHLC